MNTPAFTSTTFAGGCHCKLFGVKSFYVPRSHPNGISVNARCLDGNPLAGIELLRPFDGQSWERSAKEHGWR